MNYKNTLCLDGWQIAMLTCAICGESTAAGFHIAGKIVICPNCMLNKR